MLGDQSTEKWVILNKKFLLQIMLKNYDLSKYAHTQNASTQ